MQKRRKQSISLHDRLASFAKQASEEASKLPPGPERENLLKRVRTAEAASRVNEWASGDGKAEAPPEFTSLMEEPDRP